MTRLTIIFFLVISISSCHNKADNTNDISKAILNDTIIPFNGTWASEAYIRILKTTKSPRLSQDSGYFIQIPKSYKDKTFPYLYHEAGGEYHIIKHGTSFYLKSIDNASDSTEIIVADNGNKLKIWNEVFIKTKDSCGVPEDILFKGNYKLNGKPVTFNANGTIVGLDSIKFYAIENDYIGPGFGDLDVVYLGKTSKEKQTHSFLFKADTLFIYKIKCLEIDSSNGDCLDIANDKLRYTLIRS
ncbi:MAG TPA: hypothetical protein VK809_13505 [Bacteroidia bacterium]|jgi:hypothetical protein|nr:hypothetical protein [Bacteroidia bacterium]